MPKFNFNTHNFRTNFWQELIGSPEKFPLESRIFHSISIGLIILLTAYVPYNLFARLYVASISALIIGLFFSYQYYYSRYHGRAHNNTVFGLLGVVILGFNYFTNSGIQGSTDVIWPHIFCWYLPLLHIGNTCYGSAFTCFLLSPSILLSFNILTW